MNKLLKETDRGFGALFVLIALAVIAAVGLGGYYIWQTRQITLQPAATTQTTFATNSPTNGMKTGSFHDLKFKYSSTWNYAINNNFPDSASINTRFGEVANNGDPAALRINFTVSPYPSSATGLEAYVNELSTQGQGFGLENKQQLTIGGVPALRYDSGCCASVSDSVFFIAKNNLYEVDAVVGGPVDPATVETFKPTFTSFLSTITL